MTSTEILTGERADLLETLRQHRWFLTFTAQGLTDEQAAASPTDSALCIGGLIKHVALVEEKWVRFIEHGTEAMAPSEADYADHAASFRMEPGETLAGIIERYNAVAAYTDKLVESVDLDVAHLLPPAPWFPEGKTRSARRVLMHIVAETSQHAGHADIIRETIDGQKTMG
ncbi:DinB family protein [Lentzea sp. NPDC051838]|uniref:DinB family protein n=1 Tax=Lentzea sp. NPDC051838 TaxID=3154849 RepID=UPI0034135D97